MTDKNMKNYSIYILIALLSILAACKVGVEEYNPDYGHDYFPMQQGAWIEYAVDSTIYSAFVDNGVALHSGELREVYGETFTDNLGRTAITVARYWRTDNTPWTNITPTIWYAVFNKDSSTIERMEGDRRFIKLAFPVRQNKTWLGNSYFYAFDYDGISLPSCDSDEWNYSYTSVGVPATVGVFSFAETLTVQQQDCENNIHRTYSTETYAKGVGLISLEQWVLEANDSSDPRSWPDKADRGHVVTMRVIGYQE
jgi:hypothetical protein